MSRKSLTFHLKEKTRTRKEVYRIRCGKNSQRMTVVHSDGLQKNWERITTLFPFVAGTILINHKLAVFIWI